MKGIEGKVGTACERMFGGEEQEWKTETKKERNRERSRKVYELERFR